MIDWCVPASCWLRWRKSVQTVEGVANGGELHPVQQKLLEHGGLQCGICTPGVIAVKALLEHNPDPTEEQALLEPAILPLHWLRQNYSRGVGRRQTMRGEAA